MLNDDNCLNNDFVTKIQKRGAAILDARGQSSALSAARAIVDHVRDWFLGTAAVSICAVLSAGPRLSLQLGRVGLHGRGV